jgi:hypothetical protein
VIRWLLTALLIGATLAALHQCNTNAAPDRLPSTRTATISAANPACPPGLAQPDLSGRCRIAGPCVNDPKQFCYTMGALEAEPAPPVPAVRGFRIRLPSPNTK